MAEEENTLPPIEIEQDETVPGISLDTTTNFQPGIGTREGFSVIAPPTDYVEDETSQSLAAFKEVLRYDNNQKKLRDTGKAIGETIDQLSFKDAVPFIPMKSQSPDDIDRAEYRRRFAPTESERQSLPIELGKSSHGIGVGLSVIGEGLRAYGLENFGQLLDEKGREIMAHAPPKTFTDVRQIKGISDALTYAWEAATEGIGTSLPFMAAGGLGYAAAGGAGGRIAALAIGNSMGQGQVRQSLLEEFDNFYQLADDAEAKGDAAKARAIRGFADQLHPDQQKELVAKVGTVIGLLDAGTAISIFAGAPDTLVSDVKKRLFKKVTMTLLWQSLKGGAKEGLTEPTQDLLSDLAVIKAKGADAWIKWYDQLEKERWKYINSAAAGFSAGVVMEVGSRGADIGGALLEGREPTPSPEITDRAPLPDEAKSFDQPAPTEDTGVSAAPIPVDEETKAKLRDYLANPENLTRPKDYEAIGEAIGVSPDQVPGILETATQDGLLRKDPRGIYRRGQPQAPIIPETGEVAGEQPIYPEPEPTPEAEPTPEPTDETQTPPSVPDGDSPVLQPAGEPEGEQVPATQGQAEGTADAVEPAPEALEPSSTEDPAKVEFGLRTSIEADQQRRSEIVQELKTAPASQKEALRAEAQNLNARIKANEKRLQALEDAPASTPAPEPVASPAPAAPQGSASSPTSAPVAPKAKRTGPLKGSPEGGLSFLGYLTKTGGVTIPRSERDVGAPRKSRTRFREHFYGKGKGSKDLAKFPALVAADGKGRSVDDAALWDDLVSEGYIPNYMNPSTGELLYDPKELIMEKIGDGLGGRNHYSVKYEGANEVDRDAEAKSIQNAALDLVPTLTETQLDNIVRLVQEQGLSLSNAVETATLQEQANAADDITEETEQSSVYEGEAGEAGAEGGTPEALRGSDADASEAGAGGRDPLGSNWVRENGRLVWRPLEDFVPFSIYRQQAAKAARTARQAIHERIREALGLTEKAKAERLFSKVQPLIKKGKPAALAFYDESFEGIPASELASFKALVGDGGAPHAVSLPESHTIALALFAARQGGDSYRALLTHEVLHALRAAGLVTWDELKAVAARSREEGHFPPDVERYYRAIYLKYKHKYGEQVYESLINEEAAAWLVQKYAQRRVDLEKEVGLVREVIERILEILDDFIAAFRGAGDQKPITWEDVLSSIINTKLGNGEMGRYVTAQKSTFAAGQIREVLEDKTAGRLARRSLDELGYYSALLEKAESLPQEKGTGEQFAKMLEKGTKAAERQATGLDGFLQSKPTFTKAEIVKYLTDNRVKLLEAQNRKDPEFDKKSQDIGARAAAAKQKLREKIREYEKITPSLLNRSKRAKLEKEMNELGKEVDNTQRELQDLYWNNQQNTKFHHYSLDPDNSTYGETILHLPEGITHAFHSGHFPQPNIIGHLMHSIVRYAGKPVFLLDQIQSDWGQLIRDSGGEYNAQKLDAMNERHALLKEEIKSLIKPARDLAVEIDGAYHASGMLSDMRYMAAGTEDLLRIKDQYDLTNEEWAVFEPYLQKSREIILLGHEIDTYAGAKNMPRHPLVNTTDQWVTTTLRRAIRMAIESGSDYIAIPSGETVLSYNPGKADGMRAFYGSKGNQFTSKYDADTIKAAKEFLRDTTGKNPDEEWGYKNEQDYVFAATTRGYKPPLQKDQMPITGIVPKNLKSLFKAMGAETLPFVVDTLDSPTGKQNLGRGFTLFEIPKAVRQQVMEEGQPLFAINKIAAEMKAEPAPAVGNKRATLSIPGLKKPLNPMEAAELQRAEAEGKNKVLGPLPPSSIVADMTGLPLAEFQADIKHIFEKRETKDDARFMKTPQSLEEVRANISRVLDDPHFGYVHHSGNITLIHRSDDGFDYVVAIKKKVSGHPQDTRRAIEIPTSFVLKRGQIDKRLVASLEEGSTDNLFWRKGAAEIDRLLYIVRQARGPGSSPSISQAIKKLQEEQLLLKGVKPEILFAMARGPQGQEIKGINTIIRELADGLEVTLNQGYGPQWGYKSRAGVIRQKAYYDFSQLAKNLAPLLEDRHNWIFPTVAKHAPELGTLVPSLDPQEGYYSFIELYLSDPSAAQQKAPGFYSDFEDFMEIANPAHLTVMQTTQVALRDYRAANPIEAVESMITPAERTTRMAKIRKQVSKDGIFTSLKHGIFLMYASFVSREAGWDKATRRLLEMKLEKTGQKKWLKAIEHPGKLARRMPHAQTMTTIDIKEGIKMRDGTIRGPGLPEILRDALGSDQAAALDLTDGSRYSHFLTYIVSLRAKQQWERFMAGDIERHPAVIDYQTFVQAIKDLEAKYPEFKAAQAKLNQFTRAMLKLKRDWGLITDKDYQELDKDRFYIPFQRSFDEELTLDIKMGKAVTPEAVMKKFRGSNRDVIDPLAMLISDLYATRHEITKKEVIESTIKLAEEVGPEAGRIIERINPKQLEAIKVNLEEAVKDVAKARGLSKVDTKNLLANIVAELGSDAMATVFTQTKIKVGNKPIILFLQDGEIQAVSLNDPELAGLMYHGLNTFGENAYKWMFDLLSAPAKLDRFTITTNPAYIVANIIRDAFHAPGHERAMIPFISQGIGAMRIVRGDPLLEQYNRSGGLMGGIGAAGMDQTRMDESMKKLVGLGYDVNKFTSFSDFMRYLQNTLEYTETATRLQMYKVARDRALSQGLTEVEAEYEAAFHANDYCDYSRYGMATEAVRKLITFWNASAQGLDRFRKILMADTDYGSAFSTYLKYKTGKGVALTPGEQNQLHQSFFAWAYYIGVIGGISFLINMMWGDDERLRDIDDDLRIKSTHWIIPLDDVINYVGKDSIIGSFLQSAGGSDRLARIPKPFETAWVANLFERILWERRRGDPDYLQKWLADVSDATLPPMRPASLDYYDIFVNGIDPLSGRPIESPRLRDLAPEDRYTPYTSEASKKIAEYTGGSPVVIDAALKRVGTSWARDLLSLNIPGTSWYNPNKPQLGLDEYVGLRRFTWKAGKGSEVYNIVSEMMGQRDVVGGVFGRLATPYSALDMTAKSYAKRRKELSLDAANETLRNATPRERGYSILMAGLSGKQSKYEKLDPMNRAWAIGDAAYDIQREMTDGVLVVDKGSKKEKRQGVNAITTRRAMDILSQIQIQEYHNGLVLTGERGYADRIMYEGVQGLYDELKEADPEVYTEFKRRLDKSNVLPWEGIRAAWPALKQRLESEELLNEAQIGKPEAVEKYVRDLWFKAKYPAAGMMRLGGPLPDTTKYEDGSRKPGFGWPRNDRIELDEDESEAAANAANDTLDGQMVISPDAAMRKPTENDEDYRGP